MGIRSRLIREFTEQESNYLIQLLRSRGHDIEYIDRDDYIDQGAFASIYFVGDKIMRINDPRSGVLVSSPLAGADQEIEVYKQMVGDRNDHLVHIHYAEYNKALEMGIVIMERLEKIWVDLDVEFRDFFDYLFADQQIHYSFLSGEYEITEDQLNQIFGQLYSEDYDAKLERYSNLDDQEQQLIMDTIRGSQEIADKYSIDLEDLHIGNVMYDSNNDVYKIIDFI